jgi:CBS domain-containing protein
MGFANTTRSLDAPLTDALLLMHNEGLTSVAVVDQGLNVVGNISTADVKHLTNAASLPLLNNTCMSFISVILSERGMEHGRDSFPVFHVNPYSTLGHTVAKLMATRSHRMWVVESASPSPSAPATPLLQPSHPAGPPPPATTTGTSVGSPPPPATSTVIIPPPANASAPQSPLPNQTFATTVIPSGLPGAHLSGRLTGIVSMTDILNLYAKSSGLRPSDPSEQRSRRRRSSSASVRPSLDSARASVDFRR